MKPLNEYTGADWRRLRPLTHFIKTLRYRIVDEIYMRHAARSGDLRPLIEALGGKKVMVTVAFSDPQAIEWQARLVRRYVPDAIYVIADNSPESDDSAAIAAWAASKGLLYVRLPHNPWHAGSRSHGIALNWIWRNILRPARPEAFGFLDDDLFPTAPDDPFAVLAGQDFYGLVRHAGPRWFLWAGYCFYRFDSVAKKNLDFGQDWFNGLDTGGGNWRALYSPIKRGSVQEAVSTFVPFKPGVEVADGPLQWCGSWLHEVGTMGQDALAREKRAVVAALLETHLAGAVL